MSIDTANGYISQVVLPPKEEGDIERLYLIKDKNAQDNIKLLQSDLTSLDSELNTLDNKIDNIDIPNISNLVSTDDLTNTVSGLISKKETNDNYVTWSSLLTYYPNNTTLKNNYAHITDGIIDNATINHEDVNGLSENYAHTDHGKIINTTIDYENVNGLSENYAHITDGIINNATINYTDINNLNDHYASISNGIIDNASIDYTKINNLNDNYAHITNGSIDNATISHQKIEDLGNNYAHIANGIIDNANIDYANVNNLNTNYAHITDGIIDNANIDQAKVNNLDTNYAHLEDGIIDNALIGYANVDQLDSHYAEIDMANVNNAWIENGVIKDAAITDAQILGVSANKLTAGKIDAANINVINLRADNLIVTKINGQPVIGGYTLVDPAISGYTDKNPSQEGWYEFYNNLYTLTVDTVVDSNKNYYTTSDSVELYDQATIDDMLDDINARIDSQIETWTVEEVPTLLNYPASEWTTDELKKVHIGDICYVTNATGEYNGYTYRFAYDNKSQQYSWILIQDNDTAATLGRITQLEEFNNQLVHWEDATDEGVTTVRGRFTELSGRIDKVVKSSIQLWHTAENTTLPDKPTSAITSISTEGNIWTSVVPIYNTNYPYYFYCWQYQYEDESYDWSAVVYDQATTEAQERARTGVANAATAQSTAEDNIRSNVQLWFTKKDKEEFPNKPTSQVTNNSATGNTSYNRWNLVVPTYNVGYPYYFYCYQQQKGDGTYQWTDVVYDDITSATMETARSAISTFETFEQTTFKEVTDTIDTQGTTITQLQTATEKALSQGIEYIVGTHGTTATSNWTGVTQEEQLYTGKQIAYYMTSAGVSNNPATLTLKLSDDTWTEPIKVKINNTDVTDQYPKDTVIKLTYDGGAWKSDNYNSDTNYYDREAYKASVTANRAVSAGRIGVFGTDGKLKLLSNSAFDTSYPILYIGTAYTTNALTQTNNYTFWGTPFNLTNTHTITGAAAGKPVYIIGALNGNIMTPTSEVLTCTEPIEENGLFYLRLGLMSTASNAVLESQHPIYAFMDGKFQQTTQSVVTVSNTVNTVKQTADTNSVKISNLTQTLGTNADGTTAENDIIHQISEINQDLDGISTRVTKTEASLRSSTFATSSTAANTAAKVATVFPENNNFELYTGATITVKFTNSNTASAPTLKINSTEAKPIKTYSGANLSEAEYKWDAGATMAFVYDGTNWRIQDSTELTRLKNNESRITQTADSITSLVANNETYTAPDGTTKTNTIRSAIKQNADNIDLRVEKANVIASINASVETDGTSAVKISADKVNIEGAAIFNSGRLSTTSLNNTYDSKGSASAAQTAAINAAAADATQKANDAQSAAEATASADATQKANAAQSAAISAAAMDAQEKADAAQSAAISTAATDATQKANAARDTAIETAAADATEKADAAKEEAISAAAQNTTNQVNAVNKQEQLIYIQAVSGTLSIPDNKKPTTWVANTAESVSSDEEGLTPVWTTKRPTYRSNYPVLFVATQRQTVGGTLICTTPLKDDTTTVIDGGHITTGTIDATNVNVTNINASEIKTGTLAADRIESKSLTIDKFTDESQADILNSRIGQSNLTPYFSHSINDVYSSSNTNGYWTQAHATVPAVTNDWSFEQSGPDGVGGWAHFDVANTGTSTAYLDSYVRKTALDLKPSTEYTFLVEWFDVTSSSGTPVLYTTTQHGGTNGINDDYFSTTTSVNITSGSGSSYISATTRATLESGCYNRIRTHLWVGKGITTNGYIRISLYEGEYSGPYKPYIDQTLSNRVKSAETSIEQNSTQIALKANSVDVYTKQQSDGLISTEVTNRNAAITAATEAIELNVSQSYATKTELSDGLGDANDYTDEQVTTAKAAIKVTTDGISTEVAKKVNGTEVISAINQSAETVKIQASKVEINGTAIFSAISSDVDDAITDKGYATTTQAQNYATTAKTEAVNAAAADATSKANAAEAAAKAAIPSDISELNNDTGFITDADVPTKISELTNDSGFQNATQVNTAITSKGYQTSSQVESAITSKGYATTTQAQGYATTAKSEAISAAASDATSKANAAQTAVKSYADAIKQTVSDWVLDPMFSTGADKFKGVVLNATPPATLPSGCTSCGMLTARDNISGIQHYGKAGHKLRVHYWCYCVPDSGSAVSPSKMGVGFLAPTANNYADVAKTSASGKWFEFSAVKIVPTNATSGWAKLFIQQETASGTTNTGRWYITGLTVEDVTEAAAAMDVANNAAPKANAVKRTQRIWYRTNASSAPATPGTASSNWVTKADDGNDAWTKMHVAITSTHKRIYTCEQYEMADGTVGYTSVLLDNTITVIDGGNIITGSVTANKIAANAVTADKIAAGAITAQKLNVGDTANYSALDVNTASYYGFTYDETADGRWYTMTNLKRDTQISPKYDCHGNEKFRVSFEVSSTVQGRVTTTATSNTYLNVAVGLYCERDTGSAFAWPLSTAIKSSAAGTATEVDCEVTLNTEARRFCVAIQIAGWTNQASMSGTFKIRNLKVYKMTAGELIVDGSVTANKIAANAVTADKIAANSLTIGKFTDADKAKVDNSYMQVGGRNLLLWSGADDTYSAHSAVDRRWDFSEIYGTYVVNGNTITFTKNANGLTNNTSGIRVSAMLSDGRKATATNLASLSFGLDLKAGDTLTFSCDVKTSGNRVAMHAQYFNGSDRWRDCGAYTEYGAPVDTDWHRYSHTFTITSDYVSLTALGIYCELKEGVTVSARNFKLERGNKATDWTRAQEDTEASVDQTYVQNLTPYFQMDMTHTSDEYWANLTYEHFTRLGDGWAHFEYTNSGSSAVNNYIKLKLLDFLEPGGKYTLLIEFKNVSISKDGGYFYSQQGNDVQVWGDSSFCGFSIPNATIRALSGGAGTFYRTLTLLTVDSKDPSGTVRGNLPKTSFMSINQTVQAGQTISYDVRISLYADGYTGVYKPYVGSQLYATGKSLSDSQDFIDERIDGLDERTTNAENSLETTSEGLKKAVKDIASLNKTYTDEKALRDQWLDFTRSEGLVIGDNQSAFKTVIGSTSMEFKNGDVTLAEASGTEFIANIMRSEELHIGKWMWTKRNEGNNLSLKWVG